LNDHDHLIDQLLHHSLAFDSIDLVGENLDRRIPHSSLLCCLLECVTHDQAFVDIMRKHLLALFKDQVLLSALERRMHQ
jgi:hypothetical protein